MIIKIYNAIAKKIKYATVLKEFKKSLQNEKNKSEG